MVNLQMITDIPSSSSSSDCPEKYDVFLSFHGKDTRNNFTSHLYGSLKENNVKTFIDNEKLEKGDEISPTLLKAIEESHTSIIVFSENYASSKWCLEELSKIMECKKSKGQDVIPVFYNVDPAQVRWQLGSYEEAFMKHEDDKRHNKEKVQKWREALTEAGNLSGFTCDRNELELIKAIVGDVMKKLNLRYPIIESKRLVGIEESYEEIESLLKIRPSEVRIIGIWGLGGIGKTTLATALYAKLSSSFESTSFCENVREKLEKMDLNALRKEIWSTLLKEEKPGGNFDMTRLRRKKVFLVLDDVSTPLQLDGIIEGSWLGSGSRVIVTTRNKHVLRDDHEIYEVKQLNHDDSLELFCANAFRLQHPKDGYGELVQIVVGYCKGLPLALKVLGVYFHGKSKRVWESDLKKLKEYPDMDIHKALRLSYESLDQTQKDIFLDIACFFKGKSSDLVTRFFEGCEYFPDSGIQVLLDMALITISHRNEIEMHDLIEEMGREIVRQESIKHPERRSRLWNPKEVYNVLKNNRGTEVVEGIMLDISQIQKDIILSSDSFAKMSELRYLELCDRHNNNNYHIYLPNGLQSLPDKLRYLCWPKYCLKSLPSTFCAEMLVELRIKNSNIEKLWDGVQNLGNLKEIELDGSKQLVELPDLSMAQNLYKVSLGECESLREVHPSIFSLPNLRFLNLRYCERIESRTTDAHMKCVQILVLRDCSSLKEFSVTSDEMMDLHVTATAIHDFTSSFFSNRKFQCLFLEDCDTLKIDWNKLFEDRVLGYVTDLSLSRCKLLDASNLGHILDAVPSLKELDLTYCRNLETLPDNIGLLSSLKELNLSDCYNLKALPDNIGLLSSLNSLNLSDCYKLKALPDNIGLLSSLNSLNLSHCGNLDPDNIGLLSSLEHLYIRKSSVERLPANVKNLSMLKELYLDNCRKLVALPELPPSLKTLSAVNCISLELDTLRLLLQQCISSVAHDSHSGYVMLPRGHVPELIRSKTETTTSISIPSLPFSNLSAFLLCIILPNKISSCFIYYSALCHIFTNNKFSQGTTRRCLIEELLMSDHMIFWHHDIKDLHEVNDHYNNISFEFDFIDDDGNSRKEWIKGCGVLPVYAKDLELKLGGTITKDIMDLESNAQSSINQEPLPLIDTQMQDEKKELIENDSSDCFCGK